MGRNHSKEIVTQNNYSNAIPNFFLFKSQFNWFSRNQILNSCFPSDFRCYGLLYVISLYFRLYLIFFSLSLVIASDQFKNISWSSRIVLKSMF